MEPCSFLKFRLTCLRTAVKSHYWQVGTSFNRTASRVINGELYLIGKVIKIHSDFYYVNLNNNILECKIREKLKKENGLENALKLIEKQIDKISENGQSGEKWLNT